MSSYKEKEKLKMDDRRRIKIPKYAKKEAERGLREKKHNKAGLNKWQASKLGIASGVERAKQLMRNQYLNTEDAKKVARFYFRFRNKSSPRAETAIRLWGGRKFGEMMAKMFYDRRD
jgi:ribosomal protein L13E